MNHSFICHSHIILTQCSYIADCNTYLTCLLDLFPSSDRSVYLPVLSVSSAWLLPFLYLVPATLPFLDLVSLTHSICLPRSNCCLFPQHNLPWLFHCLPFDYQVSTLLPSLTSICLFHSFTKPSLTVSHLCDLLHLLTSPNCTFFCQS
jgi:hypothetical protein